MSLTATPGISDGNGPAVNVTAARARFSAGSSLDGTGGPGGIGTPADPLDTAVAELQANAGNGGVWVANAGGLVLAEDSLFEDAVSASGGGIQVTAGGPLEVRGNVTLTAIRPPPAKSSCRRGRRRRRAWTT